MKDQRAFVRLVDLAILGGVSILLVVMYLATGNLMALGLFGVLLSAVFAAVFYITRIITFAVLSVTFFIVTVIVLLSAQLIG